MESECGKESLIDRARRGAGHTLLAGAAGALFGGMKGYVSSQPVAFLASAYGANTMLFTGFYLATRAAVLGALASAAPMQREKAALVASCSAGAIVGGSVTAFVSGPRRLLPGALLWAGICGGAQWGISAVNGWRAAAAAEVSERRWLWASLTTEQRAAFAAHVAATPGLHEPGTSADGRALHVIHVENPHEPPPARFAAALRSFAAHNGLAAASSASPESSAAGPGGRPSSLPTAQSQPRPWYSWLPVQFGAAAGDEARLEKLHKRLREVEELLGERQPRVDEDVKAFMAARDADQSNQGQERAGGAAPAPRSLA